MKKLEVVLYILGIVIPVALLVVGVVLVQKQRVNLDEARPGSQLGQMTAPLSVSNQDACGAEPVQCSLTNPSDCRQCGDGWVCTQVGMDDTDFQVEGSFCLPQKPSSACTAPSTDPAQRMHGRYRWTGWGGVNVQNWECACAYPRFYNLNTTAGSATSGACKRSGELCRHGIWKYPCKRVPGNPTECMDLSSEEEDALVGSDPLNNGVCDCTNVPCNSNADCASRRCIDGICEGQRLGVDSATGIPRCVADTCPQGSKWKILDIPPFIFGKCKRDENE